VLKELVPPQNLHSEKILIYLQTTCNIYARELC